jgi:hypothetical protein
MKILRTIKLFNHLSFFNGTVALKKYRMYIMVQKTLEQLYIILLHTTID